MTRQLHLNVNALPSGAHPAAWFAPGGNPRASIDIGHYQRLAQVAERGLLDAVFLADNSFLRPGGGPAFALDPLIVVTAMAQATEDIGLIASLSTTFHHPYTIARAFNSLDHASEGRVGWNIVTTRDYEAGLNYGFDELPDRNSRYERALESVEVVIDLWDSWADEAWVADPGRREFVRHDLIDSIDHVGKHFTVKGPLQLPRSPQGHPLLVQAGGSGPGRDLAARYVDAVFTPQLVLEQAQEFYRDIKKRVVEVGRDPEALAVLPGLNPVVGSTDEEAQRRYDELNALVGDEARLVGFAKRLGLSPDDLDLDRPIPVNLIPATGSTYGSQGFDDSLRGLIAAHPRATVRDLIDRGGAVHRLLIGSPERIADNIEEWFTSGAADGFNVQCDVYPEGLELFVDHVIPELQRRGLFRREYAEKTLRERYGLSRVARPARQVAS